MARSRTANKLTNQPSGSPDDARDNTRLVPIGWDDRPRPAGPRFSLTTDWTQFRTAPAVQLSKQLEEQVYLMGGRIIDELDRASSAAKCVLVYAEQDLLAGELIKSLLSTETQAKLLERKHLSLARRLDIRTVDTVKAIEALPVWSARIYTDSSYINDKGKRASYYKLSICRKTRQIA